MSSAIVIEVRGAAELERRFANTPARMAQLRTAIDLVTQIIHGAVVPTTPAFMGILRGSWATETMVTPVSFVGIVGSPLIYSEVMEEGRRPGATPPPSDAIATWVSRKLGPDVSPFVVARSIGRKGIEGKHMLRDAVDATRPAWTGVISTTVSQLLERS